MNVRKLPKEVIILLALDLGKADVSQWCWLTVGHIWSLSLLRMVCVFLKDPKTTLTSPLQTMDAWHRLYEANKA